MQFQYACPNCHYPVDDGDTMCHHCGNLLVWGINPDNRPATAGREEKKSKQKGTDAWIAPLIGVVLVLCIGAAGIFMSLRLYEKPAQTLIADNNSVNGEKNYITPDTQPPVISNINVRKISENAVEISWLTNEESTTQVTWHIREGNTNVTSKKEALVLQHSEQLIGLKMDSTYYYRVISADKFNNESISEEASFRIGQEAGVAKIDVLSHNMTIEEQPSGTRTRIRGQIVNTGDFPVKIKDIQVLVNIKIPGKAGISEVQAELDPSPEIMGVGDTHKFVASVPNGTDPEYTISVKIISP